MIMEKFSSRLFFNVFLFFCLLFCDAASADLLDSLDAPAVTLTGDGGVDRSDTPDFKEVNKSKKTANGTNIQIKYKTWKIPEPETKSEGSHIKARIDLVKLLKAIEEIYQTMLGRRPDQDGLVYWLEKIGSGDNTIEVLISVILQTDEYKDKNP